LHTSLSKVELLPKSIDEIKRFKLKAEGLKEGAFLLGTRFMMQFMNEKALKPFTPKSSIIYGAPYKSKGELFKKVLPFSVDEEEAEIYVSLFDYSGVASLGVKI
jgi:hypothetical protein